MDNDKIIRCPKCRKIYTFFGAFKETSVCPECLLREEELFQEIKEYIAQHPGTTIGDLFLKFNISSQKIKQYLKADRLEILGNNNNFLKCERCGIVINSGRYCAQCDSSTVKMQSKKNDTSPTNKNPSINFRDN